MTFQPSRRQFLIGATTLAICAPAIVRAQSFDPFARAALARVTPNRSVAILGDSRTYQSTAVTAGSEYSKLAQGYITWLQFLSNQAFDFSPRDNYGVSGDTTAQILARTPGMLRSTNASTIFFLGGINDRTGGLTYQQTIENISAIRDLCLNAGRRFVILSELCRGDSTFTSQRFSATNLLVHDQVIEWMRNQYNYQPRGVFVYDPTRYVIDITSANGDCVAGQMKDGLHPGPLGAYDIAKAGLSLINILFPPTNLLPWSNADLFDATSDPLGCLNANPMMAGTAGTINATGGTGSLADSWSENAGPTWTRTYSKIAADANGKTWQQVVLGGTGTTSGVSMRQVITAGNLAIGDNVQAYADIEVDPSAANISQLALQVLDNNAITSGDMRRTVSTEAFPNTADTIRGIMATPIYALTTTTLQLQFNMLVLNAVTPAATVRIGRVALRKVI